MNGEAGRGRGWYIARFHSDPRNEFAAYELKPGQAGWVTTERMIYGDTVVLALNDVLLWTELPPEPVITLG
ncbi:MAG TPA: hypothetical protein VGJ91_20065 [Polyangiaceae bacterium]